MGWLRASGSADENGAPHRVQDPAIGTETRLGQPADAESVPRTRAVGRVAAIGGIR